MKIAILSHLGSFHGGLNYFYPLFRWRDKLKKNGFNFIFCNNENQNQLFDADVVVLVHRFFHVKFGTTTLDRSQLNSITTLIDKIRNREHCKIFYFDGGASTGSRELALLPFVDKFLKRQVFKDRNQYTRVNSANPIRIWLNEPLDDLGYTPALQEHVSKIEVLWNLGLCDYRNWHRFLGFFTNRIHWSPRFVAPESPRKWVCGFRGSFKKGQIADQRNKVIETIEKLKGRIPVVTGSRVSPKEYRRELDQSELIISPYGWGEICYRDFEAFISGGALVKPSMDHLETYPNFFIENETFIPTRWDLDDLERIVEEYHGDSARRLRIAKSGQDLFREHSEKSDFVLRRIEQIFG